MRLHMHILTASILLFGLAQGYSSPLELQPSRMSQELLTMRYQGLQLLTDQEPSAQASDDHSWKAPGHSSHKSPGKAFVFSLLVPGLGQLYYGNPAKAALFFGADVAFWALSYSRHKKGNDLTDEFNAFNRDHWSRDSYEHKYLLWVYGVTSDKDVPTENGEVSHHLPDTETQQYFEMTGKYNQFAWGWDDAVLNTKHIDDYSASAGNKPPRILDSSSTPYSPRRFAYEDMRHVANTKFDQARAMIMLAMANRIISSFEALFAVSRHNRALPPDKPFSQVDVRASLKSYYARRDTPFLNFTYRF